MKRIICAIAVLAAVGCNKVADTVVYGTIHTAESDNPVVEAIAVRNGRFIYAGDRAGAGAFIKDGVTEIIDHTGKGMVMPGCYECHAHYLMGMGIGLMGGPNISIETDVATFMEEIKASYAKAKAEGKSCIYGFGWLYQLFELEGMPTRGQLDAICPDVALYVNDSEGHKGLANTLCLQNAGILDKDGNVLVSEIRGGEICMDGNGKPNGLLLEQAGTYVRAKGIDFNEIFPTESAIAATQLAQQALHANGYVSYMDGWSNYFGTDAYYEAAGKLDREGKLDMLLGMSYEFESSCADVDEEIAKAEAKKKYTKGHVNANYVKLFIDGTVESRTGLTLEPYPGSTDFYGIANWEEDEVAGITAKANAKGLTMHIHTMGDGAVHRTVNAYVAAGTKEARNTLVHVRNIPESDFQRIADNDIVAVSGILWHVMDDSLVEMISSAVPANVAYKSYPMKSYFDHGAVMTSHTDYPATSGSPYDPFGIMELAVSGSATSPFSGKPTTPWWPEEILTREQALQALTINGAYQMHVEKERGSIKAGKWADFVLVDKDVFECPVPEIHNAKVVSTWFEGRKVFQ